MRQHHCACAENLNFIQLIFAIFAITANSQNLVPHKYFQLYVNLFACIERSNGIASDVRIVLAKILRHQCPHNFSNFILLVSNITVKTNHFQRCVKSASKCNYYNAYNFIKKTKFGRGSLFMSL